MHLTPRPELASAVAVQAQKAEQPGHPCPKCKEGTVRKPHGLEFYGCSRYKDGCTYKVGTRIAGKVITDNQAANLITKGRVGPVKGFTSKPGKPFEAALICTLETDWKIIFDFAKVSERSRSADADQSRTFAGGHMQRIIAELFAGSLEGVVVDGTPLNEWSSEFDLDCEVTLRCDDDVLFRVMGWAVHIPILEPETRV